MSSQYNKACGSSWSSKLDDSAFMDANCDDIADENDRIRAKYPPSQMEEAPQYTGFTNGQYPMSEEQKATYTADGTWDIGH